MKIAFIGCVIVLLVVTGALFLQAARIRKLEQALDALRVTKPHEDVFTSLDLQSKCSAQARKVFEEMGYANNDFASYESHYSAQLGRCFVAVWHTDTKSDPKVIWTWRWVRDAFEGKEYGVYAWHTVESKKYWEVPPFQCEVTLPSGEKGFCHSDDEFSQLVQVYMGGPLSK